ncbi:MAG TPA: IS3 family transposase [Streptomyces sp.]
MSVAAFISSQRTEHGVPHATACRALGVSPSWFYKWAGQPRTSRPQRRAELTAAIRAAFDASGGTYGSPRITAELRAAGWQVSKNTVAAVMADQRLVARPKRRRRCLTRADKTARRAPDLLGRDFTAPAPDVKWCGDLTEIPTGDGKLYLAAVEDLFSRRLLGFAMSDRHDAELAVASLRMAAAVRGGTVAGVIFHTDQGSEYSSGLFGAACRSLGVTQSMGRVGSALDNAAAESFFSTLEHEVLSRRQFHNRDEARHVVAGWIDHFYNRIRRHSTLGMRSPIDYELAAAAGAQAA